LTTSSLAANTCNTAVVAPGGQYSANADADKRVADGGYSVLVGPLVKF